MRIILDGSFLFPIRSYDDNVPFDLAEKQLSEPVMRQLNSWLDRYSIYTPMTKKELSHHWEKVDGLDKEGEAILSRIAEELESESIDEFYYFSLCRDTLSCVVDRSLHNKNL